MFTDRRGMALAIVMLCLFVLTTLAAAIIFATQSKIWTSSNYQLVTQARARPRQVPSARQTGSSITTPRPPAFLPTKYPVQYNGKPVVLSANDVVQSNYPDASVQQAFSSALLNQSLPGMGGKTTTARTVTLMSMQPASVLLISNAKAVQNWGRSLPRDPYPECETPRCRSHRNRNSGGKLRVSKRGAFHKQCMR